MSDTLKEIVLAPTSIDREAMKKAIANKNRTSLYYLKKFVDDRRNEKLFAKMAMEYGADEEDARTAAIAAKVAIYNEIDRLQRLVRR